MQPIDPASDDPASLRAAIEALERSEERLRRTLEGVDAIIGSQEDADAPVVLNAQVERILGFRPDQLTDLAAWRALVHPDDLEACRAAWDGPSGHWVIEYRMRRADGTWIWVSDRGRSFPRPDGRGPGVFGVAVDVTARHEADEARRTADARLRAFADAGLIGVVITDEDDRPIEANDDYLRTLGFTREELLRGEVDWRTVTPPEWLEADARAIEERRRTGRCGPYEKEYVRRDGSRVSVLIALARIYGPPVRHAGFVLDITEQRRARRALGEAETQHRATLETLLDPVVVLRAVRRADGSIGDFEYVFANEAACEYNRMEAAGLVGRRLLEVFPGHGPSGDLAAFVRVVETGEPYVADAHPYMDSWTGDVETRIADVRASRLGDGLVLTWRDLTERERSRSELLQIAERDRLLVSESADGIYRLERDRGRVLDVNPAGCRLLGVDRDALLGREVLSLMGSAAAGPIRWPAGLEAGETVSLERTVTRADGRAVVLAVRARLLADGTVMATARDITAERELEARVLQGQRLEAVGRLAGGIAHDFNNLLAAIQGYGELVLGAMPEASELRADVQQILFAADRAALLTRQLLAFSRRQVLAPEVLDPAAAIDRLAPMLRRLIGETVELRISHDGEPWHVRVDPGQLEQVVVNLAVNAQDAMPEGGALEIVTANVPAPAADGEPSGARVRITVRDTGHGMDAATAARVFEPFFTTKAPGKGSGMGLATVLGIVDQSGGRISLDSVPGQGTTVVVDLPRTEAPAPAEPAAEAAASPLASERILLVEDEESVRRYLERALSRLGYSVVGASTGTEALAAAARLPREPDLLVTDVQMPGMQGPELARRLRETCPDLPVLFITGYAADFIDRPGERSIRVLEKPFDVETFAAAVRDALESRTVG